MLSRFGGGHRGSGLALSAQLFGILAGHEPQSLSAHEGGFFVILFSPDLLTTVAEFKLQVSQYAHSIRSTKPLNANNPVRVPYERSISQRRLNLQANSIQVTDEVYHKLQEIIDQAN